MDGVFSVTLKVKLLVSIASNAESGAQRTGKPHTWWMKRALRARKFSVEKEGLKRPERLNCYNWQFIYIRIKSPLLRLDWLEGKTKTKMTFEFEVFETYVMQCP